MKYKETLKKIKENPTLKKAKKEFKENIGEIKKYKTTKKRSKKSKKLDKKLLSLKGNLDFGFSI